MTDRNTAVPADLVLRRGNEVLLMRRQGSGYYDGYYSFPAGHVEAGELPLEALIRETKEEACITIDPRDCVLVHTMYRTKQDATGDRADYFFVASKWAGDIAIGEPHKCDDASWFPIDALPEKCVFYIPVVMRHIRDGVPYSELGIDAMPPPA